jgi:ABC-2 type transport system permease protein
MFRVKGGRSRFLMILLTPVIMSVIMPLVFDSPEEWTNGFFAVILSIIMPLLIVGITIPDSFAGERERNTLETLLASRLPDRAILYGKWLLSVIFAWGVTILFLLVGLVTVNIKFWDGEILFYSPLLIAANLTISLLMATTVAGTGVLISLRSATVQQATQVLMMIFLVPLIVVQAASMLFLRQMIEYFESLDAVQLLVITAAVLLVIDIAVNLAALMRFRRSKLILI